MRSDTITTIALLAATATAGVVPSIKHDPITKRSEAAWNTKGNIKLTCTFPPFPLFPSSPHSNTLHSLQGNRPSRLPNPRRHHGRRRPHLPRIRTM